jgi:S1-C subfamily serine protease
MNKTLAALVLVLVAAGFFGGLAVASRSAIPRDPAPAAIPVEEQTVQPPRATPAALPAAGALPDLSSVAEAALEGAANITSTNVVRREDPWSAFFGEPPSMQTSQSLGSGVVVSPDGLILTNTHVIGSSNARVKVTLTDGRERDAEIVGIDELSDLTVLRVKASGLATIPWGDSSKLRVAQWVLAIGNPFQLSGTVTLGIISSKSRSQSGGVTDFIQTDAAINSGNSGGALVNARGELVGINTMIINPTGGGNLGIGFAIPSNLAREIMTELVRTGSVPWGSIGYVTWADPEAIRNAYRVNVNGPLVYRISETSAAYRAGLRRLDVLLTFNKERIESAEELETLVAKSKPGTQARVEIERENKRLTLTIPVESRSQQQVMRPRPR